MKETQILFQGWKVKKILEWDRTVYMQTRRIINPQPVKQLSQLAGAWWTYYWMSGGMWNDAGKVAKCRYGQIGDRLWVRESYALAGSLFYRADGMPDQEVLDLNPKWHWRPSIFMPRCFSRITLEIVKIRMERVQEITNNDALAEGTPDLRTLENKWDLRDCYRELWNSINAKRGFGWDVNPWVWVIEFKRVA